MDTVHSLTPAANLGWRCRRCGQEFTSVMRAAAIPCPGDKEKRDG